MMRHPKTVSLARRSDGLTIIEVMFVLAIGGGIFAMIFMAIPALQRANRNDQRKQDVATMLGGISHYELNNSGNFPTTPDSFISNNKMTYYTTDGISLTNRADPSVPSGPITAPDDVTRVNIYNYYRCDSANVGAAISTGAGYTDIVALYAEESGSGANKICQQL